MKYVAPDYEKVTLHVEDMCTGYPTGCPEDEGGQWSYTKPCEGTSDYRYIESTYTGLGWGSGCYSTHNP